MVASVLSPKPVKPLPNKLASLDPGSIPASERRRQTPSPSSIALPPLHTPPSKRKRAHQDADADCAPASKRHRTHAPSPIAPSVECWILGVPRPTSAPLGSGGNGTSIAVTEHIDRPKSLPSLDRLPSALGGMPERLQDRVEQGSGVSASTSRPGTSSHLYRSALYYNGVVMDYRGKRLPKELQEFRDTNVLNRRLSPPLDDDAVHEVMDTAEELADSTEYPTTKLMRTSMFPFTYRAGLGEGGNTQWLTDSLPNNPHYHLSLAAPKPDMHFGYATGQRSDWTIEETNVIDHRKVQPYAQPTRDNSWPFLMIEMKSEAAGGTRWHAENQAAGSGSSSSNAVGWLLKSACQSVSLTDTVSFTITTTHRDVVFYLHWQSIEDRRFYMSYLKQYSFMEPQDIRSCNKTVKNIIDYGLGARKTRIRGALQALFPFPEQWKDARKADSISDTPATSFTAEDTQAGKRRRQKAASD